MSPVPLSPCRKFLPSLDKEDTRIANFSGSLFLNSEASFKLRFVLLRVCEPRRRWLGFTDTTSRDGSVDFWFVKTEHLDFRLLVFALGLVAVSLLKFVEYFWWRSLVYQSVVIRMTGFVSESTRHNTVNNTGSYEWPFREDGSGPSGSIFKRWRRWWIRLHLSLVDINSRNIQDDANSNDFDSLQGWSGLSVEDESVEQESIRVDESKSPGKLRLSSSFQEKKRTKVKSRTWRDEQLKELTYKKIVERRQEKADTISFLYWRRERPTLELHSLSWFARL